MRVILQPVGDPDANRHYAETIERPVAVDRILRLVADTDKSRLAEIFGNRPSIPTWGTTPGKNDVQVPKWERMQAGDLALFSRNNHIISSSFVAAKVHARNLALDLWQTNNVGETWEYVYFLDEMKSQRITYADFNRIAGYKEKNVIQGFNVLDETKSLLISQGLDLQSQRYQPDVPIADYLAALRKRLAEGDETDGQRAATQRLEQGALRQQLFGRQAKAKCCICGVDFSVDFLIASHVKKRAHCSNEERLDFANIAAPMCKAGCDALYEQGYIYVSETGAVCEGRVGVTSDGVRALVDGAVGQICNSWSAESEPYFKWHRDHHLAKGR